MRMCLPSVLAIALTYGALGARADEEAAPPAAPPEPAESAAPAPVEPAAPRIVVFLPEQIDGEWFWFDDAGGQQHLAQTAVEKALVNAGFDVIDVANIGGGISLDDLITPTTAAKKGAELGATYAIAGKATAVKASEGSAYGVRVVRANAEITARLVRVSDGKVLAVEDASAQSGGQAARAAGQDAVKKAAHDLAHKVVGALRTQTASP